MRKGFTLIELLVVLAVVATLLTLAVPRYFGSIDRSKEAVLKALSDAAARPVFTTCCSRNYRIKC